MNRPMTGSFLAGFALVFHLGVAAAQAAGSTPAEDVFQSGVRAYQAGDAAAALKLFMAAAKAGNTKAVVQVGWSYEFGAGVSRNVTEAAKWYKSAAEQGDPRGQKNLGALFEEGRGVPEDWVEAAKWYRKSADQNDDDGQAALARAYEFGIGVPQSRDDAIYWDRRAAAQGNAEADRSARWLSNPTNNIGFRNAAERNLVIGYRMVDVVVKNEPIGRVFHDHTERDSYLLGVARQLDADEAYSHPGSDAVGPRQVSPPNRPRMQDCSWEKVGLNMTRVCRDHGP